MRRYQKILLTGGSGKLGQAIQGSNLFAKLLSPSRQIMDITKPETIAKYFKENDFDTVIHCAAMARISECETYPLQAIDTNIFGTCNLVGEVIAKEKKVSLGIRFIHLSTDGVYPGTKGYYKETDSTIPCNHYGWTKLSAECAIYLLKNFCIVRTNFFDPDNIRFNQSAEDLYTSKIPVDELAKAISHLVESDFVGIVNVGGKRESDFNRYRKFNPALKPCKRKDILKTIPFKIALDSSFNTSLWKKISKQKTKKT